MDDWKDDKTFIIIDLEQLDAEEPESETGMKNLIQIRII